jgi:DNA modification methylase
MEKLEWITKKVKVKDLVKLEINPRKITEQKKAKLVESLEKFNLVEIPAVNTDLEIIGGNQRVTALMLVGRGDEEIDVRFPNRKLTKKEVKEYAIISNTHAGEFDFDILEAEFSDIDFAEIGFDIDGLDEWEKAAEQSRENEAVEDDFEVPPTEEIKTDIVQGDLFEIGEHRLLCGDSTDVEQVGKLMNGKLADMVMTDPPYNVNYDRDNDDKIQNDNMNSMAFYTFLLNFYKSFSKYTKNGGVWYVWHTDNERINFTKAFEDAGFYFSQCLIWVKNSLILGRLDYHKKHETCLYGWKKGAGHYFTNERTHTTVIEDKLDIKKLKRVEIEKLLADILSDKSKSSVIYHNKPIKSDLHSTMKPILLLAPLIENSSKQKWIVSDGFLGSGSTMIASHQINRICYGMEIEPKYCDVIVTRMMKLDNSLVIKRNGVDETRKWLEKVRLMEGKSS